MLPVFVVAIREFKFYGTKYQTNISAGNNGYRCDRLEGERKRIL